MLAYVNLCSAEELMRRSAGETDLTERLPVGRVAADQLARYARLSEAIPGGVPGVLAAMQPVISPVDEFIRLTQPRVRGEAMVRLVAVTGMELEIVQRVADGLDEAAREVLALTPGTWRAMDYGSAGVLEGVTGMIHGLDELSNYSRRVLGEAAAAGQRLLVRDTGLRALAAGQTPSGGVDDPLARSIACLDDVLVATSARLAQLGLRS
nr:ferritin-like fold-containing protein [Brooklawnia cerclae]